MLTSIDTGDGFDGIADEYAAESKHMSKIETMMKGLAAELPQASRFELGILASAANLKPGQYRNDAELAAYVGLTRSRVQQIAASGLAKLRKALGDDEVLEAMRYFAMVSNQEYKETI